jgi:hypothetical protein
LEKETVPLEKSCPDSLPEKYGNKRVVLLPVEPGKVHVYWEFDLQQASASGQESCHQPLAEDDPRRTKPVLRFYEVTTNASGIYFDLEVDGYSGNRYVDIPRSGGSYVVEFGFKAATGDFFPAIRSEVVKTPPLAPAESSIADNLENDGAAGVVADSQEQITSSQNKKLAAVSASTNINFLGKAVKNGSSQEEIRAAMDRLWRLTLRPDEDLPGPSAPAVDLTELCEKRFLFGNSSK